METKKAKVLSEAEFRARVTCKIDDFGKWHVRAVTADNAYSRQYDKSYTASTAKDRFIKVWYPVYLDDMGALNEDEVLYY
jgi:hypothetical protein